VLVLTGIELFFFHNSLYGTIFWIGDENSIDNAEMFSSLLSSAYTESRPLLLLTLPHRQAGWGCTRTWEGTEPGQLTPKDQRDIPYHMMSCPAIKRGQKKKEGGDVWSDGICLLK